MNSDLMQRLDTAFGDGPEQRPVFERITAGRRALRTRRMVTATGGLVAALVLAGGLSQLSTDDAAAPPVSPPSATVPEAPEVALTRAVPIDRTWRTQCDGVDEPAECASLGPSSPVVGYLPDGQLARLDDDVTILQRVDDPVSLSDGDSVALETRTSVGVRWWYLTSRPGRTVTWLADPGLSQVDFEGFAANLDGNRNAEEMPPLTRVNGLIG